MLNRRDMLRLLASAGLASPFARLAFGEKLHQKSLGICSISYALRWPRVDRGQGNIEELLTFVDYCHSLGAGGVQTSIPTDRAAGVRLRNRIEEHSMYLEGQIPLPRADADLDAFETRVLAAKEAGASILRTACLGGRRYESFQDAQSFRQFAEQAERALARSEPILRKHGLRLAVENHKDWRVPEFLSLLKRLDSEHIGVCVDTGNSIALLEEPLAVVEGYAPYALATHLKDMAVQEYEKGFLLAEVPLGEGFLDLPGIVGILQRAKPDLQFSLEMITRDPLPIPCLTRPYWATFENLPAWVLAGALSMVRGHASREPLPKVSLLTAEEKVAAEDRAVRRSLSHAREHLQLLTLHAPRPRPMAPIEVPKRLDTKATGTRHWVLLFAASLAVMTYVTRVCISQRELKGAMMQDLGLTDVQMGYAFAAFAWGYALFEIPGGWLGDWLGPRRVLMRIVIWWSFFTAATGLVRGFPSLLVTRFLFGAGEAGCFPSLAKVFTAWLPRPERSRAIGIMWLSARWGGALTPILVTWVLSFLSWRQAFEFFGAIGIVWAILFYSWYRDNPRHHTRVNAAELALLAGNEQNSQSHAQVPWRKLLESRTVWMLWLQYFCFSYGWYFYITWLPTYLHESRGVSLAKGALLSGVPLFFGGIGSMLSGTVAAWLTERLVDVTRTRRALAYTGFIGAAGLLILSMYIQHPVWAMLSMGMASFALDLALPGCWSTCLDVGGKYAGTLSGSMNMMGNLAGGVAPIAVAYILETTGRNWPLTFWISAVIYVLGGVCWHWIDPVTPLEGT